VTTAQRARLVVALGILNLVLATLALGVGAFGVPSGPPHPDTAANSPSPSAPPGTTEPEPTPGSTDEPGSTDQPGPTDEPTEPPGTEPPSAPPASVPPAGEQPTEEPSAPTAAPPLIPGPGASEPPAVVPASNPPLARPPTATPTPRPEPTAPPAPTPAPVSDQKPRPPCPQNVSEPPGKAKVDTRQQPCGKAKGTKVAGQNGKRVEGGLVVIFPIAGAAAWFAGAGRRGRARPD